MSDTYRRIGIAIDAESGRQIYPDGLPVRHPGGYPGMIHGETAVICLNFFGPPDHPGEPLSRSPLPENMRFAICGGKAGLGTLEGALFRSEGEECCRTGDYFDGTTARPDHGELSFRVRFLSDAFRTAAAQNAECELAVTGTAPDGEQSVLARCRFLPLSRAGGEVTGGNTEPGGGGETASGAPVNFNPVVQFTVAHPRCGRCSKLDATTPELLFADHVYDAEKLRMRIVSDDFSTTGNAVLIPSVNGEEMPAATIPVTAELSVTDLVFPAAVSGKLAVRRDLENEADTLGETALVIASLEIHHRISG